MDEAVRTAEEAGHLWVAWLDELAEECVEDSAKLLSSHWSRSVIVWCISLSLSLSLCLDRKYKSQVDRV
jgi:hypothetical protein